MKIAAGALPPPLPDMADLAGRLADLGALLADGRWTRLASELDLLERELATATAGFKAAERAVVAASAQADLLIVARDGDRARLGPKSLGKATRFVVDHAACPVLLVWPGSPPGVATIPPPPHHPPPPGR